MSWAAMEKAVERRRGGRLGEREGGEWVVIVCFARARSMSCANEALNGSNVPCHHIS